MSQLKRLRALRRERALNRDADLVVSVSRPLVENALEMTGAVRGLVLPNGFDPLEWARVPVGRGDQMTITYVGTLYAQQRTSVLFGAIRRFVERHGEQALRVRMIGTRESHGFDRSWAAILAACPQAERIVELTARLEKQASLQAQRSSALLAIFAHPGTTGIYSGKIFEYVASGVPVLLTPSDHDVIAELLRETGAGEACDTEEEALAVIERAYAEWRGGGTVVSRADPEKVARYSYQELSSRLSVEIERLLSERGRA